MATVSLVKAPHTVVWPADPDDWHKRHHGIGAMTVWPTLGLARRQCDRERARGERCWVVAGDGSANLYRSVY